MKQYSYRGRKPINRLDWNQKLLIFMYLFSVFSVFSMFLQRQVRGLL
jgi:hypothetical protein